MNPDTNDPNTWPAAKRNRLLAGIKVASSMEEYEADQLRRRRAFRDSLRTRPAFRPDRSQTLVISPGAALGIAVGAGIAIGFLLSFWISGGSWTP